MTNWLVWGIFMLASYCEANVSSSTIADEIEEGQKKITEIAKASDREVEEVRRYMNSIFLLFSHSENESMIEGTNLYKISMEKMDKVVNVNFEEAIDRNKGTKLFLSILEIKGNTEGELRRTHQNLKTKITAVIAQKTTELMNLKNLIDFTHKISTGFYEGLKTEMIDCKEKECVLKLIDIAEEKQRRLAKIFAKHEREMFNISAGLKDGQRDCLRDTQKGFGRVLKNFELEFEYLL